MMQQKLKLKISPASNIFFFVNTNHYCLISKTYNLYNLSFYSAIPIRSVVFIQTMWQQLLHLEYSLSTNVGRKELTEVAIILFFFHVKCSDIKPRCIIPTKKHIAFCAKYSLISKYAFLCAEHFCTSVRRKTNRPGESL